MIDEIEVDRGVSQYGVHMVHVIRAGERVEAQAWIEKETVCQEVELVDTFEAEDESLGVWHFWLFWKQKGAKRYEGWFPIK